MFVFHLNFEKLDLHKIRKNVLQRNILLLGGWGPGWTQGQPDHTHFRMPFFTFSGKMIPILHNPQTRQRLDLWRYVRPAGEANCIPTNSAQSICVGLSLWLRQAITSFGSSFQAMGHLMYPPMLPSCTITECASLEAMTVSRLLLS